MPEEPMGELVERPTGELALLSNARQALAQARTIPDFHRVMEMASVASDAASRAAKLMEAQGVAAEIVKQANEAANDAAAVRLEAQAGAGRIIAEMKQQGLIRPGANEKFEPGSNSSRVTIPELLGVERPIGRGQQGAPGEAAAYLHASRWQKVGEIPDDVRAAYIEQARQSDDPPTTAGLLRYAAPPRPEPEGRDNLEVAYDAVVRHLGEALQYDPKTMASHANLTKRRTQFRKLMDRMRDWVEKTDDIIR